MWPIPRARESHAYAGNSAIPARTRDPSDRTADVFMAATLPPMEGSLAAAELGLQRHAVRLAESNHAGWVAAFDEVAPALWSALGDLAIAIEHVGSTSVPDLVAKPILDIQVGLAPPVDREPVISSVTDLGYIYRGEGAGSIGMLFVWEDQPEHRQIHVHAVEYDSEGWRHTLAVRDRLRADPTARERYAQLKRALAEKYPDDRASYTAGKDDFIAELLSERDG